MVRLGYWRYNPEEDSGRVSMTEGEFRKTLKSHAMSYLHLIIISSLMIWSSLPLFFGAVYKRSNLVNSITLYVIDLDGGEVGSNVTQMVLGTPSAPTMPVWSSNYKDKGIESAEDAEAWIRENGWGALIINQGASERLHDALSSGAAYNASEAMTILESTGRHVVGEMLFVQTALVSAASNAALQYALGLIGRYQQQKEQVSGPAVEALTNPLGYTAVDVAPENFPLSPAVTLFGFLVCLLCTIGILIMWKMQSFAFFLKVRFRDLAIMWPTLILALSLILSLYFSLAFLAFKGMGYNSVVGREYTAATFFKIWLTVATVPLSLGLWLFSWFLNLTPDLLALPSVCTVLPNVVSCVATFELAPKFFRIMYATPFFNATRIVQYIISGAYPTLGRNIGVLVAEILLMAICLVLSVWVRQFAVVCGISDMHGWYRGMKYFHAMVPYYKSDPVSTERRSPSGSESTLESPKDNGPLPASHGMQGSVDSIDIQDCRDDDVSLKTGNLGV
ncbi:hypothetical protein GQ54DRAFT_69794 [Martensiomyces pterosporus]|nr:hypothetical protein GQ54DRAFT_69794 [Martensiomyces pterosporus]